MPEAVPGSAFTVPAERPVRVGADNRPGTQVSFGKE